MLPRVLALTAMVPLLTLYADLMGVLGGYLVGVMMLDLNPMEYINATTQMVPFKHVLIGLVYGTVFGVVIAVAGCYQACAATAAPSRGTGHHHGGGPFHCGHHRGHGRHHRHLQRTGRLT